MIDREIGLEHFSSIDEAPLATASVAQIHAGLLKTGREVVVKVRRPGIVDQVQLDLELLRKTAAIAEKRSGTARLLQLNALADELDQHLLGELDFREEAHNAELISSRDRGVQGRSLRAGRHPPVRHRGGARAGAGAR